MFWGSPHTGAGTLSSRFLILANSSSLLAWGEGSPQILLPSSGPRSVWDTPEGTEKGYRETKPALLSPEPQACCSEWAKPLTLHVTLPGWGGWPAFSPCMSSLKFQATQILSRP